MENHKTNFQLALNEIKNMIVRCNMCLDDKSLSEYPEDTTMFTEVRFCHSCEKEMEASDYEPPPSFDDYNDYGNYDYESGDDEGKSWWEFN
jgi:hypothetical protein